MAKTKDALLDDPENARAYRAMMGLLQKQLTVIVFIPGMAWVVHSTMSGKPKEYMVTQNGEWACTCPDFTQRQKSCKHIAAVKLLTEQKV
jgi:predicted nucleic acid-binding Zn finger protein